MIGYTYMKIFEILEDSWNLTKKNYKNPLLCAGIISFVVQVIAITLPTLTLSTADILTQKANLSLLPTIMFIVIQTALLFVSTGISYAFLSHSQDIRAIGSHTLKNFLKIISVVVVTSLVFIPFTVLLEMGSLLQIPQLALLALTVAVATIIMGISIALQSAPLLILEKNETIKQALKNSYLLIKTKFIEKTANYIGALFIAIVVVGLAAFIVGAILSLLSMGITKIMPNLSETHVTTIENIFKVFSNTVEQTIMMITSSAILVTWYKKVTNS